MNGKSKKEIGSLFETIRPLWSKRFGTFWVGSLFSNIGTWMQQVAEPWLVLSLSGSSLLLGVDAFAMDAPVWILTLFGGVLADRADRRRVIFFFQSIQMFCPVLLVFLILRGWIHPWMIIALSSVVGITDALSMPAFQATIPSMVESKQIGNALALNSTQFNISRILGPVLAGIAMARFGAVGCFGANAFSYIPLLLCVYWVIPKSNRRFRTQENSQSHPHIFSEIREISRNGKMRGALLTVLTTSVLCGPMVTFCPVLVKEVFHSDVSHFSGALTAFGIGGLAGGVLVLLLGDHVNRMKLCSVLAILYGGVVSAIALSQSFVAFAGLLVLAGAILTASNTSANSILQYFAPEHIRGQTASLYMLSMRGGMSLGNLMTGISVTHFGVTRALVFNGVLALLIQFVISKNWIASWKRDRSLVSSVLESPGI